MKYLRAVPGRQIAMGLWMILVVNAGVGIVLFLWSVSLPEYTDPDRANQLITMEAWMKASDVSAFTQDWFRQIDEVRSAKWPIQDAGIGLFTLSLCLLGVMIRYRVSDAGTFLSALSPCSLAGFLLSVAIVWIGLDVSAIYVLFRDSGRHYAPPWADSLGIPLAAAPIPVMLLPIPLLVGWLIVRRASLPASLWIWDRCKDLAVNILHSAFRHCGLGSPGTLGHGDAVWRCYCNTAFDPCALPHAFNARGTHFQTAGKLIVSGGRR